MTRHIITALIFVVAITFYIIGAVIPGTAFLILGGLAELMFWFRVIKSDKSNSVK